MRRLGSKQALGPTISAWTWKRAAGGGHGEPSQLASGGGSRADGIGAAQVGVGANRRDQQCRPASDSDPRRSPAQGADPRRHGLCLDRTVASGRGRHPAPGGAGAPRAALGYPAEASIRRAVGATCAGDRRCRSCTPPRWARWMTEAGYDAPAIQHAQDLVRKKNLRRDPDAKRWKTRCAWSFLRRSWANFAPGSRTTAWRTSCERPGARCPTRHRRWPPNWTCRLTTAGFCCAPFGQATSLDRDAAGVRPTAIAESPIAPLW